MSNDDSEITEEIISLEKSQDEIGTFEKPFDIFQCKSDEFKIAFE
jgi:hypothetical protein